MTPLDSTPQSPLDWLGPFNRELNLWSQDKPGHTASVAGLSRVHSYRQSAQKLLLAAQTGQLNQLPIAAILRAFCDALSTDENGELCGPMRWYVEETEAADTNIAFFVCLPLLVLKNAQNTHFEDEENAEFARLFAGFDRWFDHEVQSRAWHYPNKFMGDLVCSWLLKEVLSRTQTPEAAQTLAIMDEAANYWAENGWGWGEHLSDTYAGVLLNELSALLLFSSHLPADVRANYGGLFGDLMRIEDAFYDRPRVPAIRSYAFSGVPRHQSYRARIAPLKPGEKPDSHFSAIFDAHRWHDLATEFAPIPNAPSEQNLEIPCFGGAVARSFLTANASLGSLSRFPIIDGLDWPTWGLSWQSFPVAFWRRGTEKLGGCWGFWEWNALESGRERFHPAREQSSSYLSNALSDAISPSISGQTASLQNGANLLFLRRMPALSTLWERAGDGFRLFFDEDLQVETRVFAGELAANHVLRLSGENWALVVRFLQIGAAPAPQLIRESENQLRWSVQHDPTTWKGAGGFVGLWGVSLLEGQTHHWDAENAPKIQLLPDSHPTSRVRRSRETGAFGIEWTWPHGVWQGEIDPLAAQPLQMVAI